MIKSPAEHISNFLLGFLPSLLPAPLDDAAKSTIDVVRGPLEKFLSQPRLQSELLEAARQAEIKFRNEAQDNLKSDRLVQAIVSFPIYDHILFQESLAKLPHSLNEEILAENLRDIITNDWKGKFAPDELREGIAIYLNCLRAELLRIEGFADIVTRLAVLRVDQHTEKTFLLVQELVSLVSSLLEKTVAVPITVATTLFTIPLSVRDFIGRENELEQLKVNLSGGVLIMVISGSGGIGKTELARKLANELKDDYPDARMNIDLLGTSEAPLAPEECMRRLLEPFYPNQKLPDNQRQLEGLYQQTFSTHKALLLLDNAANVNQVRSLIPSSPSAAIVTSRQYFSLTEFGLKEPLRLEVLSPEESRSLLRAASNKLEASPDSKVDNLSELCGYLPLALRVAVSLLNDRSDWTLDILLQRLGDERTRLQRLKRPDDADFDVEAAISLSYNLLPDNIKQRFRMLGVFPDAFWNGSVAGVWMNSDLEEVDTSLGVLLTRSLLSSHSAQFGTIDTNDIKIMSYYTLHDLTRLFALDRLRENHEEFALAIGAHAVYFLELAVKANDEYLKGHDRMARAVNMFHAIWLDLFTAWHRIQNNQNDWPRPDEAAIWISTFPNSCAGLLMLLIRPTDRIEIIEVSLECARRLGDRLNEGANLSNLGAAYAQLGAADKAIEIYKEALLICETLDDPIHKARAMENLGTAYIMLNKLDQAIQLYEQALAIYDALGDQQGRAGTFANLGSLHSQMGKPVEAKELYENGLLISQQIGNRALEAVYLNNLGQVYRNLNEIDKAISFHQKALKITEELHDEYGQGEILGSMGVAFSHKGDFGKAMEFYKRQLATTDETGNHLSKSEALANIGNSYSMLGHSSTALEFFEQALPIARELGDRLKEANILGQMGIEHKRLGEKEKAGKFWRDALAIYKETADPRAKDVQKWLNDLDGVTVRSFVQGAIEAARTKKPEAAEYFEAASNMARDPSIAEELQEVGKVLREYLAGIRNPDLSRLSAELAKLWKEELEKHRDDDL